MTIARGRSRSRAASIMRRVPYSTPWLALTTTHTVSTVTRGTLSVLALGAYGEILDACEILSSRKIGALIALEGSQTLRMYEEAAKPLDAILTTELLVTIFTPDGPLHDGAVIVRANRVVAANAFLPLTTGNDPKLAHGTRHRAAVGLSEESDALVIVISEENGSIAAASEGKLDENLDRPMMLQLLTERFGAAR